MANGIRDLPDEGSELDKLPIKETAPQPEDTPAEGYSPTDGPTNEEAVQEDDCCPHGYFVGRGCPEGCVDDEGQRADPPVVEVEPAFDAEGNIIEVSFVEVTDEDIDLDGDEEFANDEPEPDDVGSGFETLLAAVYSKGWNAALAALGAKFSDTGAFLEVRAAIDKLRKE